MTVTGLGRARTLIPEADIHFVAPSDFSPIISHTLSALRPKALLIVETEIWPNMIAKSKTFGCYVAIISGKMSDRGFRRYRIIRPLMACVLGKIDILCVQAESDRVKFIRLGAAMNRVKITGNVKALAKSDLGADPWLIRQSLGIAPDERVVVFGCVREGEEEGIAVVSAELKARFPELVSIFAPRHMDRLGESERAIARTNLRWIRRSGIAADNSLVERDVILLDTMGELSSIYSIAEVAFVGGSFVPVKGGGHDPFEPAAWGVPVVFGPHMGQRGCETLESQGAAFRVKDPSGLSEKITFLLENADLARASGEAGRRVVCERSEAVARTVEYLMESGLRRIGSSA